VSHCDLAIYIKKFLKAKRRIEETQIFHHAKNIIFKKISKRNQNPSRYYNCIANLKFFNTSQNIIFQKSSYQNKPISGICKVRKTQHQNPNPEFGHTQDEIFKKPAKEYISNQGEMKLKKPSYFGSKLSFILSFLFP